MKHGIDIISNERIQKSVDRFGDKFLNRIYTQAEQDYCKERQGFSSYIQALAVRYAAKEAVAKAFGTGFANGIIFKDIEVVVLETGEPTIRLQGVAQSFFEACAEQEIIISLSHEKEFSIASVIMV